ncbi:uncharacterized protein K452DRAFT_310220 [Aplosporella prunicola CBS 121167]|uniref:C3H1-type domain-containing protein n=1 Tax=Aplosporella prunicola CBS 121167 TaxID=1176127 RepID=A0A6A6B8F8_9PEZI|nr:uncharacterized protein K452DRAFT_310220 [Aplosporella prunicola CBS 121167]KAF2139838.1 hypothetical protein K452DRAFT_310220 [Aplosporella prunicola CBS 121167]
MSGTDSGDQLPSEDKKQFSMPPAIWPDSPFAPDSAEDTFWKHYRECWIRNGGPERDSDIGLARSPFLRGSVLWKAFDAKRVAWFQKRGQPVSSQTSKDTMAGSRGHSNARRKASRLRMSAMPEGSSKSRGRPLPVTRGGSEPHANPSIDQSGRTPNMNTPSVPNAPMSNALVLAKAPLTVKAPVKTDAAMPDVSTSDVAIPDAPVMPNALVCQAKPQPSNDANAVSDKSLVIRPKGAPQECEREIHGKPVPRGLCRAFHLGGSCRHRPECPYTHKLSPSMRAMLQACNENFLKLSDTNQWKIAEAQRQRQLLKGRLQKSVSGAVQQKKPATGASAASAGTSAPGATASVRTMASVRIMTHKRTVTTTGSAASRGIEASRVTRTSGGTVGGTAGGTAGSTAGSVTARGTTAGGTTASAVTAAPGKTMTSAGTVTSSGTSASARTEPFVRTIRPRMTASELIESLDKAAASASTATSADTPAAGTGASVHTVAPAQAATSVRTVAPRAPGFARTVSPNHAATPARTVGPARTAGPTRPAPIATSASNGRQGGVNCLRLDKKWYNSMAKAYPKDKDWIEELVRLLESDLKNLW